LCERLSGVALPPTGSNIVNQNYPGNHSNTHKQFQVQPFKWSSVTYTKQGFILGGVDDMHYFWRIDKILILHCTYSSLIFFHPVINYFSMSRLGRSILFWLCEHANSASRVLFLSHLTLASAKAEVWPFAQGLWADRVLPGQFRPCHKSYPRQTEQCHQHNKLVYTIYL